MAERFGHELLLLERLAAGGMAEVFRAKQIGYGGFEKTVAVKRILPNYASDEEFKGMFRQEVNLSACLQHQNIVQVFGNGEFEGYLYLVMEFVDGKNVRQMLSRCERKKKRIPIELALFVIAETSKGLNYAHQYCDEKSGIPLNIVHRDMSPQNVMVGYDCSVKIVDFGIAKAASWADNTRAGVLKGKFGYMSPEQARGEKLDSRTDIFALGIILFEMLTQRRLFTSEDDLRTIKMVKDCNVPRPSKYNPAISSQLDRIVLKALDKNKAERYQTAQELYEDIIVYLNQKFPKFVPTELSRFLKDLFKDDISEDKKKREKQAAEAPAIVGPKYSEAPKKSILMADDKDRTEINEADDEKTQLSRSNIEVNNLAEKMPSDLEVPVLESPLNLKQEVIDVPSLMGLNSQPEVTMETNKDAMSQQNEVGQKQFAPKLQETTNNRKVFSPEQSQMARPSRPNTNFADSKKIRIYLAASLVVIMAIIFSDGSKDVTTVQKVDTNPTSVAVDEKGSESPKSSPALAQQENKPEEKTVEDVNVDRPPAAVSVKVELPKITLREVQGASGPYGRIRFNTIPRSDEIYINGKLLVNEKGEPFSIEGKDFLMPPGEFTIHIKNNAFDKAWKGTLVVQPDMRQERDVVLK